MGRQAHQLGLGARRLVYLLTRALVLGGRDQEDHCHGAEIWRLENFLEI